MFLTGGKMFMQYGLIFMLTYFTILLSGRVNHKTYRDLIAGTLMGLQLVSLSYLQTLLGWHNLPDGRYFFAVFSVFFWGPIAVIPIALGLVTVTFFHPTLYLFENLFTMAMVTLVAYAYRSWIEKKKILLRWPQILILALTPTTVALPLANFLYRDEIAVEQANDSVLMILIAITFLTFTIIYSNARELERKANILLLRDANTELEGQNIEIRALYEEMAASEEALQENYIELNTYKDQLEFLAYHDPKTGLYNREYFQMTLGKLNPIEMANKVLLYLRVNHFEQIEDTLGQTLIEILHKIIAREIEEASHGFEGMTVFQLAYGRFVVLANAGEEALELFLGKVYESLSSTYLVENMVLPIEFDVGALKIDPSLNELSILVEYAEIAMLQAANHNIRNKIYWFSEEMYKNKQYQTRLEFDLQKGLEEEQFFIVVQPQYKENHEISGAEVLIRWRHPEFGLISPVIFIPLAERLGLIGSIGHFVFNQTLQLAIRLKSLTESIIPLSVNTSMIELVDLNFSRYVNDKLLMKGLEHQVINIEITESALVKDMSHVQANLDHLLGFGMSIHLDDFGTGYSSLSHLSQLPVSHLKIDKAFIDNIQRNEKDLKVVQTIIELGHRLDMKVIAEGVELEEQVRILHEQGCDFYQGYYFSKPVDLDVFCELLIKKK